MKFSFSTYSIFIIIIFFIRLGVYQVSYADTALGTFLTNTTLNASQTYTVDGSIVVPVGVTLTIPAGTHFIFTKGSELVINGNLIAKGTSTNHIVITGGVPAVFIPEVQSPIVTPTTQTIDTATPDVVPPAVNTVMLGDDVSVKHAGIRFDPNATGTLSYVDIQDATDGMTIDQGSTVTVSHGVFTNCDIGILGVRGTLNLSDSSFNNVPYPAQWDFHGTFTHSNSTFSNTTIKGWVYGGDILPGEVMQLTSSDGVYSIAGIYFGPKASLNIESGVTVLMNDANPIGVEGLFSAEGTADKPVTLSGNGVCTKHSPIATFTNTTVRISHVIFNNLCNGIAASGSTVVLNNDTFNTVAGTAIQGTDYTTVNASGISMNDVYQAFNINTESRLSLSEATISLVNGKDPAIEINNQTVVSGNTVSIDGADTCIDVSKNSSITIEGMTLTHCKKAGLSSTNDIGGPSGITITDSEITQSGTALNLNNAQVTKVSNDKFHDNTIGVSLTDMPDTTISNNWWGSNNGPTIADNPGGDGDSIVVKNVPSVIYRPWIGMTTAPDHNPVIIVPGITGSVLTKNYDDKSELWPNIANLALSPTDSFLNDLELLSSGTPSTTRPITVGDIIRSAPGTDVFDGLIATLLQNGYKEGVDLFVMPYDWRLSNTVTEDQLTGVIANALKLSGKTKINIIAHSMGGLLVKDYIAQHPKTPIDNLFFIGNPNLGAPKAFKALMYGDDMGYNFSVLGALSIHVLNPDRIKIITQNMPSVFELLPSKKYIDAIGSYIAQQSSYLSNADTITLMKNAGRNSAMFPFIQKLHDSIDSLDLSNIPTYNFVGCGATKTVGKILLTKKESLTSTGMQLTDAYHLQYVAGDGTVPVASATAMIGSTNYFIASGSHGTLPSTTPVKTAIAAILNGNSIGTINGLSSLTKSCALSGDIVEIHSPVTLDIYDDQGRHTGPTSDGDVEFGIPNVDYETIGDDKFAFLPSGPTYKIVNHAQAVGSYDMYISHSADDDTITSETYFHEVPLTSTDAIGTTLITPNAITYSISMDQNGDGTADSTIAATSSLSAVQATDITPPVTTAILVGTTVSLSAIDDNSGVLNTKYSLDGITWNSYTNPFQVIAGDTVQFLSMDNAGNVENIQNLVVPTVQPTAANTQTSDSSATTVTTPATGNTYYYGGTTINEPTASNPDQGTNDQDIPPSDNPDMPQTQTDDSLTETPEVPLIPTVATPATAQTESTLVALPIITQTMDTSNVEVGSNTILADNDRKLSLPEQLAASVAGSIPIGNKALIILFIVCVVVIIIIRKGLFKRKSSNQE